MHRVNYDQIAHLYDEPVRDHDVDPTLLAFLAERPDLSPATCASSMLAAARANNRPPITAAFQK